MRTIVYILCPARSGSTLLGNLLGSHSQVQHIGEIPAPLRKNNPFRCRSCVDEPCPLWGSALREETVRDVYRAFTQTEDRTRAGVIYDAVFPVFENCTHVIDSSKSLAWVRFNVPLSRYRFKFVFLQRDLRGCWASFKRNNPEDYIDQLPRLKRKAAALEAFRETLPAIDRHNVAYEALMKNPREVTEELCRFLGLRFEAPMLDYYRFPHHLIGGNPGPVLQFHRAQARPNPAFLTEIWAPELRAFYEDQPVGFIFDERWKTELSPDDLKRFEA
ncbi:MAG: sulfotransferase [Verrucomicrobiota bacterium]